MVGQFIRPFNIQQQDKQTTVLCQSSTPNKLGTYLSLKNETTHSWCTFEVVDTNTFIVQCVYLGFLFFFFLYFISQYLKLTKLQRDPANRRFFSEQFNRTYRIITYWFLSTFIRVILCIVVYLTFMKKQNSIPNIQDDQNLGLEILASIFNFFNLFCAFIVNFLILFIPYHWIKNLLGNINEGSRVITMENRKKLNWFHVIKKITKIYYKYVRNFILLLVFSEPIIYFVYHGFQKKFQMPFYNCIYTVIETMLFLVFYIYASYVVYFLQKINVITIKYKDLKHIFWQYSLLLLALLTRLALDIHTAIIELPSNQGSSKYQPDQNCLNQKEDNSFFITLSFHHLLMHLLPIIVVLFIYRPVVTNRPSQIISAVEINDPLLTQSPTIRYSSTNTQQQNLSNKEQNQRRSGASSIFNMNMTLDSQNKQIR